MKFGQFAKIAAFTLGTSLCAALLASPNAQAGTSSNQIEVEGPAHCTSLERSALLDATTKITVSGTNQNGTTATWTTGPAQIRLGSYVAVGLGPRTLRCRDARRVRRCQVGDDPGDDDPVPARRSRVGDREGHLELRPERRSYIRPVTARPGRHGGGGWERSSARRPWRASVRSTVAAAHRPRVAQ
ncbi:MAG: hypothetical protein ACRDXC_11600 [Acidimicrobiales bacterium]